MKVRRKSPVVDAVQWVPGMVMDRLKDMPVEVIESRDGKWFYVHGHGERADRWLPVDEASADEPLHFAFYEVKAGMRTPVSPDAPLVKRYGAAVGWKSAPQPYAILYHDADDSRQFVHLGDWIVGGTEVVSAGELTADYDVVESA